MTISDKEEAQALREAYMLVQLLGNSPFIGEEGLDLSVRIQIRLCKRYNDIVLKTWKLQ